MTYSNEEIITVEGLSEVISEYDKLPKSVSWDNVTGKPDSLGGGVKKACVAVAEADKKWLNQGDGDEWELSANTKLSIETKRETNYYNLTQSLINGTTANTDESLKNVLINNCGMGSDLANTIIEKCRTAGMPESYIVNGLNVPTYHTTYSKQVVIDANVLTPKSSWGSNWVNVLSHKNGSPFALIYASAPWTYYICIFGGEKTENLTASPSGKYVLVMSSDNVVNAGSGRQDYKIYWDCDIWTIEEFEEPIVKNADALLTTDVILREQPTNLCVYDNEGKLQVSSEAVKQIVLDNATSEVHWDDVLDKPAFDEQAFCEHIDEGSKKFLSEVALADSSKWNIATKTTLGEIITPEPLEELPSYANPYQEIADMSSYTTASAALNYIAEDFAFTVLDGMLEQVEAVMPLAAAYKYGSTFMYGQNFKFVAKKSGNVVIEHCYDRGDGRPSYYIMTATIESGKEYAVIKDTKTVIPYEEYLSNITVTQTDALLTTDHISRTEPNDLQIYDSDNKLMVSTSAIENIVTNAVPIHVETVEEPFMKVVETTGKALEVGLNTALTTEPIVHRTSGYTTWSQFDRDSNADYVPETSFINCFGKLHGGSSWSTDWVALAPIVKDMTPSGLVNFTKAWGYGTYANTDISSDVSNRDFILSKVYSSSSSNSYYLIGLKLKDSYLLFYAGENQSTDATYKIPPIEEFTYIKDLSGKKIYGYFNEIIESGAKLEPIPIDAVVTTEHILRTEPETLEVYDEGGKLKVSETAITKMIEANTPESSDVSWSTITEKPSIAAAVIEDVSYDETDGLLYVTAVISAVGTVKVQAEAWFDGVARSVNTAPSTVEDGIQKIYFQIITPTGHSGEIPIKAAILFTDTATEIAWWEKPEESSSLSSPLKPFFLDNTPKLTTAYGLSAYLKAGGTWMFKGLSNENSLYGNLNVLLYQDSNYSSDGESINQNREFTITHNNALNGFTTDKTLRHQIYVFNGCQKGRITLLINKITTSTITGEIMCSWVHNYSNDTNSIPSFSFDFPIVSL